MYKGEDTFAPDKHKHLVIYNNVIKFGGDKTLYYEDIAVAKNEAGLILGSEPAAHAYVFQIRSTMASTITVNSNDFNM